MKGRYWIGACLMACAFVAVAASGNAAVRKQVEASMLLTGTIDIGVDGSVTGHALDHADKLEAGVIGLVDRTLPAWRFEPVVEDGKAHKATAKMSLLIVANKLDADHFTVRIRSANFAEDRPLTEAGIGRKEMAPPKYPAEAYRSGVTGTVYLLVRVDRQGRVADVAAEQVNLRIIDSERQMRHWRDVLAEPALKAARNWQFNPPTARQKMDGGFWSVRVPVSYALVDEAAKYGKWEPYVPGPRQDVPWLNSASEGPASSPDALVAGGVYEVGQGLRLLTPLGDG
jgi:hypothetical protein